MKKNSFFSFVVLFLSGFLIISAMISCNESTDTSHKADTWFEDKAWLSELKLTPHETIDQQQFRAEYEANKQAWDKAFAFLKNTSLDTMKPGRHVIDGENVFALVTQPTPKSQDTAAWEVHQKYIDIHHIISGKEMIALGPLDSATETKPYDAGKDIAFYTSDGKFYEVGNKDFLIIFPPVAHCPGVKVEGYDQVKKIVIKIRKAT